MADPIRALIASLRDVARVCGDLEAALPHWHQQNLWAPRRGEPMPVTRMGGIASDPVGTHAIWLAGQAERDLGDVREARRLIIEVLERRAKSR